VFHESKEDAMKIKLLGLLVLGVLIAAAPSLSASPPIVAKALAIGTMNSPFTLHAKAGAMIVDQITVKPGGSFGWHTHGAAVAVVITGGALTVYDPTVAKCAPQRVSKGQSFIEPANHLHMARNEGTKPATLYAFYLGLPSGSQANRPGTAPTGCTS
jgi:quercetin dioxygenase-like cupin family protein